MIVLNKPGASGAVGTAELINAKPDGYKIGIIICELTIIPNLGVTKYTASDLRPIAQLNADPSAVSVRADAPWQTIEEFLADVRKRKDPVAIANAGVGSIWHMAAAAFAEKANLNVNHVPYGPPVHPLWIARCSSRCVLTPKRKPSISSPTIRRGSLGSPQ